MFASCVAFSKILHYNKRGGARESRESFDRESHPETDRHRGIEYGEKFIGFTIGKIRGKRSLLVIQYANCRSVGVSECFRSAVVSAGALHL